jgi:hypothetical protein
MALGILGIGTLASSMQCQRRWLSAAFSQQTCSLYAVDEVVAGLANN